MPKKIPQRFEARDGKKFETEAEAAAHEEKLDALDGLTEARQRWEAVMKVELRTADGESLDFGLFDDHYIIRDCHGSVPYVQKVDLWRDKCALVPAADGGVEVYARVPGSRSYECLWERVHLSTLYRHKKNADAVGKALARERLAEFADIWGLTVEISEESGKHG